MVNTITVKKKIPRGEGGFSSTPLNRVYHERHEPIIYIFFRTQIKDDFFYLHLIGKRLKEKFADRFYNIVEYDFATRRNKFSVRAFLFFFFYDAGLL